MLDIEKIRDRALDKEFAHGASIDETLQLVETILEMKENFDSGRQIAIIWSIEDVQEVRPDLSEEEAMYVLDEVERTHDATIGINWGTLECVANELYPSEND